MQDKRSKHNNFSVFLICLTAVLGVGISYAGCGKNINEGIQKIIDEDRIRYNIPGLEVSVSCPGEDLPRDFVSGTTMIDGIVPVQSNHLFQIGSETKSFIAAIMLQLEAEGRLSIQDAVGKYIQNIPDAWQNITIQQLLNHTSGIFNYTNVPEFWDTEVASDFQRQWTADELVNVVFDKKLNFLAGQGWDYSNTNYVLAGMLISVVTGNPIEHEIKTRLIDPLRLSNTYYLSSAYSDDILQQMAHGYSEIGLFPDDSKDITNLNLSWGNTAGAIVSTSHDTAIWFRSLLTSNALLPNTQRQELMSIVDLKNGQPLSHLSKNPGYGLGVIGVFDSPRGEIWTHAGGTLGYLSQMYWLKFNDVVVTSVVNHVNKDDMAGDGSGRIMVDLIDFIQRSDTTKQSQMGFTSSKQSLSKQLKSIECLDQLIPKRSQ